MTIEVIEMAVATAMHLALVLRTLPFLLVGKAEIYPQMATDMGEMVRGMISALE